MMNRMNMNIMDDSILYRLKLLGIILYYVMLYCIYISFILYIKLLTNIYSEYDEYYVLMDIGP